jgi:large subunit ribosomal protein L13
MEHKIDASDKVLGRLATQIVVLLRGKNDPRFDPARILPTKVTAYNLDKMRVTGKKMDQKLYRRHSGFHGGLKEEKLKNLMERDSRLVLEHAVRGMLPKNKLRDRVMKNLVLLKGEEK